MSASVLVFNYDPLLAQIELKHIRTEHMEKDAQEHLYHTKRCRRYRWPLESSLLCQLILSIHCNLPFYAQTAIFFSKLYSCGIHVIPVTVIIIVFILLHEKFLQFDWLRAVVFQLNLKYLQVKITNSLLVVV